MALLVSELCQKHARSFNFFRGGGFGFVQAPEFTPLTCAAFGQTIGSGETVQVTAPDYSKFDLMVTSTDGGEEIYYDFPGGVSSITLNGGGQANYQ